MRFAIYARSSSDMQLEMSLEDQEIYCRQAIAERNGTVVAVFRDSAKSGWSLDRDGFHQMRQAAQNDEFDALMVWKFDRLARDSQHATMIKLLLRQEYGIGLYCVEGYSEDDDNDPMVALFEQILAVWSAFYSQNLSTEAKRAKKQRAIRGEFNGSRPPLGYDLVTRSHATDAVPAGLYVNPEQASLVQAAFQRYATGEYSDAEIAAWFNEQPLIQELRAGKKPIGKEMVRDLLQNRTYTGRVAYSETLYSDGLGRGKKSARGRKAWFEGKHEALISDALYAFCQEIRAGMVNEQGVESLSRIFLLGDRVYCSRCICNRSEDLIDNNYGKMRTRHLRVQNIAHYRCLSRERGYGNCGQHYVQVPKVDQQVIGFLCELEIPGNYQQQVEAAIRHRIQEAATLGRMDEIQAILDRIEYKWDNVVIDQEDYFAKRQQLQDEIQALQPLESTELIDAADLIQNFQHYWEEAAYTEKPILAQKNLLDKIVDRVFVYDQAVVAISLHGGYSVILPEHKNAPNEILVALESYLS